MSKLRKTVDFNVYGPIEDKDYWEKCENEAAEFPSNVSFNYKGFVQPDQIDKVFQDNHVFLFPTYSENYGHVIIESLLHGVPVIISDQTPWKDLKNEFAGDVIPLEMDEKYLQVINMFIEMDNYEYSRYIKGSFDYARKRVNTSEDISSMMGLLNGVEK